jgi:hypothetical protein
MVSYMLFFTNPICAQMPNDGIMMQKKYFCVGANFGQSNWKNYWEGTYRRDNLNLGHIIKTNSSIMGNYGITDNINLIFGLPHISSKATAGNLADQRGIQDGSIFLKAKTKKAFHHTKGIIVVGASMPLSDYSPDILPLSIGLKSKTISLRAMADYEKKDFATTISAAYIARGNVRLNRNTYYTTEMHYTNMVQMPHVFNINFRTGYRSNRWIAEAIFDQNWTLGGFDISKNNMPFVSNRMNSTQVSMHVKHEIKAVSGLSVLADGIATIAGRNIGQDRIWNTGIFYIMDFAPKTKSTSK